MIKKMLIVLALVSGCAPGASFGGNPPAQSDQQLKDQYISALQANWTRTNGPAFAACVSGNVASVATAADIKSEVETQRATGKPGDRMISISIGAAAKCSQ